MYRSNSSVGSIIFSYYQIIMRVITDNIAIEIRILLLKDNLLDN